MIAIKLINILGLKFLPFIISITILVYAFGIYYALYGSPADFLQGEYVRIMYVHVPSAWLAIGAYVFMGIASIVTVIYNNPLSDIYTYAMAPIGMVFAFICLLTGSIWGKPVWGAWWVWDPRLTSMLILLFLYLGYIIMWDYDLRCSRSAAVLNIIGLINIPVIKYSVHLWNSIHQPASITLKKISIDFSMMIPLVLMFVGSVGLSFIIWVLRIETLKNTKRYRRETHT